MTLSTARRRFSQPPEPPPIKIPHEQGYQFFQQVLDTLRLGGWTRLRVDTYQHPLDENASDNHQRWTVRHHYDHGAWELYFEPDRYWHHESNPHPEARKTLVRLDRELPTVAAVLNDLFGPKIGRYFPAVGK